MTSIGECPPSLKAISHYLKLAIEHDSRDPVVGYWARLFALQAGLKLSKKEPDEQKFLIGVMDFLENYKKQNAGNEAISNEVVAQAHLENYALKLFQYADKNDRASNFNKNVVKAFFSAGQIYDVLQTFGDLTDEAEQNRKYAKWKATYIHTCLKNGETPIAGPMATEGEEGFDTITPQPSSEPAEEPASGGWYQPSPGMSGSDLNDTMKRAPSPPKEPEKSPGGFKPFNGSSSTGATYYPESVSGPILPAEIMVKAQKYCKYAGSALNYEDVPTAIENLQKALMVLQTGRDS